MKLFDEMKALKQRFAPQKEFYQVLIAREQELGRLRQVFTDIDEKKLKRQLVNPYKKGTSLICENEIIPVLQIQKIQIVRTTQRNEVEREALYRQYCEVNGSGPIGSGSGYDYEDILKAPGAKDVTSRYITAPPGTVAASSLFARFVNHPWVVTVGGGVLVFILGYFFHRMVG